MREYLLNGVALQGADFYINDQLNRRTTFDCTITSLLTVPEINIGDTITLKEDAVTIFSGVVKNLVKFEAYKGVLNYKVSASDNSALADKRLVAKVYSNTNVDVIVNDIIDTILFEEGVTAGVIHNDIVIEKAVFNYISCSDALDYLKDITGYNWEIDFNRQLNFFSRDNYTAPNTLNDDLRHFDFEEIRNLDRYRNVQYTRGGLGETSSQPLEKPAPKPDGQTRTFTLRFPIASKPDIFIDSVQVNANDVGINGKERNKKWYYTINGNTITQDPSETVLTTEILEVTYKGYRHLFGRVDDPSQINSRKLVEDNTSGIYERVTDAKTVNDINQLRQFGQSLIEKYGDINNKVSFETEVSGFKTGQLLTVQKPLYGIAEDFLIESVNASPIGENIQYSISALDGASLGGWEQFFKSLYEQTRQFVIAENELLIILNTFLEKRSRSGVSVAKTFTPPKCAEGLVCGTFVVGGLELSEVTLYD